MRGPTLSYPSSVFSGHDDETRIPPEDQIAAFRDEILAAIPLADIERIEDVGALPRVRRDAEIVALYLARFWHFESPWWADEALRKLFSDKLPVTKAAEISHTQAADLRLAGKGQSKTTFKRQGWEDHTFFQVAAMRAAHVSAREASQHAARWREEFSNGEFTIKASVVEKNYPEWAYNPLRGMIWCNQIARELAGLTPSQKLDLIQSNKLRVVMLPPCPDRLKGERHSL